MDDHEHAVRPKWAVIPKWMIISGDSRSTTYEKLGDGRLRGIKDNGRTKIDVEHGLAQMSALEAVKIKPAKKKVRSSA